MDDDLDEGAGQLIGFIGLGLVAGADLDDQVPHADALTRQQAEITREAVALVEHADDGDALGHGGGAGKALRLDTDGAFHRRRTRQIVRGDRCGLVGRRAALDGDRRRPAEHREAGEDRDAAVHSGDHAS
jgi:hypothetical protein